MNRNHVDYDAGELAELLKVKDGLADLKGGGPINLSEVEDSYKYEIDHIRYSLGKYHRQIKGYGCVLNLKGSLNRSVSYMFEFRIFVKIKNSLRW